MTEGPAATPISKAKDTLLRALDQLEKAEQDLEAPPDDCHLIVVYSIGRADPEDQGAYHEVGGWSSTGGPKWLFAKLLARAAAAFDEGAVPYDDTPDEDDDE